MRLAPKSIVCLLCLIPFFASAELEGYQTDWPLPMNSSVSFDVASKCEMLVFTEVLNDFDQLSVTDLSLKIKVKNVKEQSVNEWKKLTKERILNNFDKLSEASLSDVISIQKGSSWAVLSSVQMEKDLPNNFLNWYENTKVFYADYVHEQIRLAALYPRITSEILQLSENEIQGFNFTDKNFLLTFDDGPTVANGNTDKLIKVLDNLDLSAMFFVLGENLKNRLNASSYKSIKDLYGNNSVLSHGKVHESHQKYSAWKASIDETNDLIHEIFPTGKNHELIHFRPPYGQRNQELVDYFTGRNSKIIYWNIDSRDWSSKLTAKQVADRQIKLMLLWRSGILLFHDIHSKAQKSVPDIHSYFENANIIWMKPGDVKY